MRLSPSCVNSDFTMKPSAHRPTITTQLREGDEDQAPSYPGSTLARNDGPYSKSIESLYGRLPYLRYRDFELFNPASKKQSRVMSFRGDSDHVIAQNFANPDDLCKYLHQPQDDSPGHGPHRELFILEGLDPCFVDILGQKLKVDPNVFMRHEKTGLWQFSREVQDL
jgi:hypothetical protein